MTSLYLTAYGGSILGPIAKVLGWVMDKIYVFFANVCHIESIALTILIFTILIYVCMFPVTYNQQKFSVLSKKMQPEINALNEKYKGKKDQASQMAQSEEMRAIYDKYGVSPSGSCVYMLIQMPILFALYRVFWNVPAYITSVKNVFTNLVSGIQSIDGYQNTMKDIMTNTGIRALQVNFDATDSTELGGYIVDLLYKLSNSGWDYVREVFPTLIGDIDSVTAKLEKINYLFVLNISDTPWNMIKDSWALDTKNWAIIVCALLIPLLSYASQVFNTKLSMANTNMNDQQAQQMKTMNTMMPLMSLFIAFTVPVGLGFYWIIGAVVRSVQQIFLNKHFEKIDMDDIIEANKEKAAKKAEKRGIRQAQIYNAANMKTKNINGSSSMSDKASISSNKNDALNKAAELRSNANPNSLAAKANKVKEFNERNNK